MRVAEGRRENAPEIKCLRTAKYGGSATRTDSVRNFEIRRSFGMGNECASGVDRGVECGKNG